MTVDRWMLITKSHICRHSVSSAKHQPSMCVHSYDDSGICTYVPSMGRRSWRRLSTRIYIYCVCFNIHYGGAKPPIKFCQKMKSSVDMRVRRRRQRRFAYIISSEARRLEESARSEGGESSGPTKVVYM